MLNIIKLIIYFFLSLMVNFSFAQSASRSSCDHMVVGINMAGPEFGANVPGRLGFDYKFPTVEQMSYYRSVGFSAIRLPILWERLQPELMGELDAGYLSNVNKVLKQAAQLEMRVLVDLHNYARFRGQLVGSPSVPAEAFRDVWSRLALALHDQSALYGYGLMNEPYNTNGTWEKVAQAGVDGIRQQDKLHFIFVAGDGFSSAERWGINHKSPFVVDPVGREVYEGHVYLDKNSSGKYATPNDTDGANSASTVAAARLQGFIDWLQRFGKRGAIGEYGVPSLEPAWFGGVDTLLQRADQSCLATFVWAGGAWSPGYKLSLEPNSGVEKPLTLWFRQYFKDHPKRVAP